MEETYSRREFLRQAAKVAAVSTFASALPTVLGPVTVLGKTKRTLEFWRFRETGWAGANLWQTYANEWNREHPDVQVRINLIPVGEYLNGNKLSTAFAAGAGPDIFVISPGDFDRYVNAGIAYPLNAFMSKDVIDDYYPTVLGPRTWDGKIYALPYEVEPMAVFYNRELFAKKNLKPPKDWHELVELARTLQTKKMSGFLIETQPGYYQNFTWYPYLWSTKTHVLDEHWTRATIDEHGGAEALQFWGDLVNKYKVSPRTEVLGTFDITNLAKGFCAMQNVGIWAIAQLREQFPHFDYGVFPIPPAPGGIYRTVLGGWALMVNAKGRDPEAAARFCVEMFATNKPDAIRRGADWIGLIKSDMPPRKAVWEEAVRLGYMKNSWMHYFHSFILPTGLAEPRFPPPIYQAVSNALQAAMFRAVPGKEAAATAAASINAFLKTYRGVKGSR